MARERADASLRPLAEAGLRVEVVPPLSQGTARIELLAAGRSAEVRAIVPLHWADVSAS